MVNYQLMKIRESIIEDLDNNLKDMYDVIREQFKDFLTPAQIGLLHLFFLKIFKMKIKKLFIRIWEENK